MKNLLIAISLICLLPTQLFGQATVVNNLISGTNFQVSIGYQYQQADFDDLNSFLSARSIPALSDQLHSLSFLTNKISDKWILSLGTSYALPIEETFAGKDLEFRSMQYFLGAGYAVVAKDKLKLLPGIRASVGRNILLIQENPAGTPNFDDLLEDPYLEADLRNYSFHVDLGLSLHYQLFKQTKDRPLGPKTSWIPLIIKTGYQFQLGSSSFKYDGDEVQGVPDIALQGFYAGVYLGFGSRLLKNK